MIPSVVVLMGLTLGTAAQGVWAAGWQAKPQPDLKEQILRAGVMWEVNVGVPIYTVQSGYRFTIPNPDGKTCDVVQWYYKNYAGPYIGIVMDLATREMRRVRLPFGMSVRGGRALAPNGKHYIVTRTRGRGLSLIVYDPATNGVTYRKHITERLKGETIPLAVGTDGMIYGAGSYPDVSRAGIYQVDPATDKVTLYGPVGPSHKPNATWGYSVAADDRCVYVASGKIPWYLVAYDRGTGKAKVLLETPKQGTHLGVVQERCGCTAFVLEGFKGTFHRDGYDRRVEYWLHQGKLIPKKGPKEAPPWPEPKVKKPWVVWPPRADVFAGWDHPKRNGDAELWYRTPEARAAAPKKPPAAAKPEDLGWQVFRYTAPIYANRRCTSIIELPDGRIFGKCDPYQGNFMYDPAEDKLAHLGGLSLSQYCMKVHDGKVYMSGYPSSALYVYDPARPWTVNVVSTFRGRALPARHKDSNRASWGTSSTRPARTRCGPRPSGPGASSISAGAGIGTATAGDWPGGTRRRRSRAASGSLSPTTRSTT